MVMLMVQGCVCCFICCL